jgi:DMSO/TMAO reductase YedYZ molybdopterin-dependent catalytic subunit
VLSAGPTPRTPLDHWSLTIDGAIDEPRRWSWSEFLALPSATFTVDIHCVTKWSTARHALDGRAGRRAARRRGALGRVRDGMVRRRLHDERAVGGCRRRARWIAYEYGGEPLEPEHGGPARLLVPHLYFWKSAKWLRGLALTVEDEPGFWETYGYHDYGDPWREQRYWGD